MTGPENKARELIDLRLRQAGWVVHDMPQLNPATSRGLAVREFPNETGPAVYVQLLGRAPVGVIIEATHQMARSTYGLDPLSRSRELFHFFLPQQLAAWLAAPNTFPGRVASAKPALPEAGLRNCQVSTVTGLEKSLAEKRPSAQVSGLHGRSSGRARLPNTSPILQA